MAPRGLLRLEGVLALLRAGEAEADRDPSDEDGPAVPEEQDECRVRHVVARREPFRTGQHGPGDAEGHDSRGHGSPDPPPDSGARLVQGPTRPGGFSYDDVLAAGLP